MSIVRNVHNNLSEYKHSQILQTGQGAMVFQQKVRICKQTEPGKQVAGQVIRGRRHLHQIFQNRTTWVMDTGQGNCMVNQDLKIEIDTFIY